MAATAYRYLINLPGVRGGNTIIEGTRIGVHDVIGLLQNGETIDSVCSRDCFPDITKAQVYECLAYYEDHRGESMFWLLDRWPLKILSSRRFSLTFVRLL